MKKDYCDITFILDRSGSMSTIKSSTIEGYNKFLRDQKEVDGEIKMTLIQFDDKIEIVYDGKIIEESLYLSDLSYIPRGMTALLDAIGIGIKTTGERLSSLNEDDRPDKVLFVILTDGQENNSKEYDNDKISEMIKHQTDVYKWEFLFLGANQDAIKTAKKMNIKSSNSMTYYSNDTSNMNMYGTLSDNIKMYRANSSDISFSDDDRLKQEKSK